MNTEKRKLPIGIDNFEELRRENFYYVDKTGLIMELLRNWGKVNLFTRPRRFGKTLNMSMLKCFFELGCDTTLFHGLKISADKALCRDYMGKFPVIFISLRGVDGNNYESARLMLAGEIQREAERFQFLTDSSSLSEHDKKNYLSLLSLKEKCHTEEGAVMDSLSLLSRLLHKHYSVKTIILVDEYDVPLANASNKGFYDQMITLVKNIFQQSLKSNESLQFGILTGCLRIAKESIFTGLNNLKTLSITDVECDEYFGFTDREVQKILLYYNLTDSYDKIKEWYDGYRFGNEDIYCPWDVICHCSKLRTDPDALPEDYWSNTSSNHIVRHMLETASTGTMKREIEQLIAGETVTKELHQELTYKDLYQNIDHIWSILFTTGYLTQKSRAEGKFFRLAIPNREIQNIFLGQIMDLFKKNVQKDGDALDAFCNALIRGDALDVEQKFQKYLEKTISLRDSYVKKHMKENFYHGILLGLLGFKETWVVSSNRETGEGYSDITVETEDGSTGIIIEVKYAEDGNLDRSCQEALAQIEEKHYEKKLLEEGINTILKYGIACYKKRCKALRSAPLTTEQASGQLPEN